MIAVDKLVMPRCHWPRVQLVVYVHLKPMVVCDDQSSLEAIVVERRYTTRSTIHASMTAMVDATGDERTRIGNHSFNMAAAVMVTVMVHHNLLAGDTAVAYAVAYAIALRHIFGVAWRSEQERHYGLLVAHDEPKDTGDGDEDDDEYGAECNAGHLLARVRDHLGALLGNYTQRYVSGRVARFVRRAARVAVAKEKASKQVSCTSNNRNR